jgi:hypothetical protein
MSINIETSAVSLTADVVTKVVDDQTAPKAREDGRCTYEIYNDSAHTVYLGGASVTTSTGIPLPAGTSRTIALRLQGEVFAISASNASVRVMRVP